MSNVTPANTPTKPYKAVAAFFVTVIGLLWANLNGRQDLGSMKLVDWLTVIVPTILATGAVYGITNPAK